MSEKVSPTSRRPANASPRRSAASAAALRAGQSGGEDYFTPGWGLLLAAYVTIVLIFFLFTPYTHQLDEIKNIVLMTIPPVLLGFAVWKVDFSAMTWRTHAPTFLLGIYTLVMVISYLLNPYKPIGERVLWYQVGTATFTVIFAWFMNNEAKLRKTMMFFVLLALASTILGLVLVAGQGFTDAIYNSMKDSAYWRTEGRAPWVTLFYTLKMNKEMYSSVLNSDFYAAFLVMTIPIPLSMFFVERHLLHKSIALAAFLLMNVCLFLTNSNDSFMSIIVVYAIWFVLGYIYVKDWGLSRNFIITFLLGSLVLGATVLVLMWPTLARTWDFKSDAISGREILWEGGFWPWLYFDDPTRTGFDIDIKSFLFGTGPGGYRFYFPVFRDPAFFDNQINNVTTFGHNLYLDILMETGLLGLLAFLGFYGVVLWNGFQQIRRTNNPVHRFYQIALVSGLTGIALQNFFSPNYRWAVCGTIYWALFGLSMGLRRLDVAPAAPAVRSNQEGLPWPMIWKSAVAVLAGLFILRSPIQGLNYWKAAVANGLGLRYLDYAETTTKPGYKDAYLEEAANLFREAIKTNPTFVTSYYKLAHVYNQLGDTNKATETYEALQAMNPNYSEIHQNLAIMYSIQARDVEGDALIKKMEDSFREAVEGARQSLKPNMQWLAGSIGEELAAYYLTKGQDEKAMEVYEKIKPYYRSIIEYKPRLEMYAQERLNYYPRAQAKLVRLAELTGKPKEAEPYLQQMYRDNPDKPEYLQRLMAYYDKYGTPQEKIKFLESAVHDDPLDVDLRRLLAQAHLQAGDETAHRKELRRIEILEPNDKTVLTSLYTSFKQSGQDQKAAEYRSKLQAAGVNPDAAATTGAVKAATVGTTAAAAATAAPPAPPSAPPIPAPQTTPTALQSTVTAPAAPATTGT